MDEELDFMPPQQSLLVWLFRALGIRYSFLIPFYALLAFVLAALAIWRFKTPYLTVVLLAVVPLPFYCGAIGVIDGLVASFQVMSFSGGTIPLSYVADSAAVSLVSAQVGLVLSLPLYVIAVVALCLRSFVRQPELEG
jgi:hypothetical protein